MKQLIIIVLFIYTAQVNAQHDNNWYFGQWAGLQFSNGSPLPLIDSALSTVEGSAVMSDENGALLFYTNGMTVWNRNHVAMVNGTGLFGGSSATQAALIIPKPGQPSHYYIFTVDHEGGANGLRYSEVDMDASGGFGAIIDKNVPLITPVCEKVVATYHANGTDIWVTTHHWGSNSFYSYLVTAAGVSAAPVVSTTGMVLDGANNSGRFAGHMAISPDGSHLALVSSNVSIELCDYNNETGMISNAHVLKTGTVGYGIDFSPSGNMVYAIAGTQLLQYQVNVPNPASTETLVANVNMPAAIRLAPDSKLYVVTAVLSENISVINKPDLPGTACNFVFDQTGLGGRKTLVGLPAFLASPLYITGMAFVNPCLGNDVSFSITSTVAPENLEWDFGDGNSATGFNPSHTYLAAGTYIVKATAKRGIFRRFFTQSITILPGPAANQPTDIILCDDEGNNGLGSFTLSTQDNQILGSQSNTDFSVSYHLSESDAQVGINPVADTFANTVNPQTIYARVTNNQNPTCGAVISFNLIVKPAPVIEMKDEYFVCSDNIIALTAPAGFNSYFWSTGETTRTIFAEAGTYELTVATDYGNIICSGTKSIKVTESGPAQIKNIEISDWTDEQNTITVVAEGAGNYQYSIDGNLYQSSPVFDHLPIGFYTVYVRDKNGCGLTEEDIALLTYPRFFTPNGDGINDIWRIKYSQFESSLKVDIIDRYGKVITSFMGGNYGWDGTYNGHMLPSTDYWFVIKRQDGRQFRGHFSMIR